MNINVKALIAVLLVGSFALTSGSEAATAWWAWGGVEFVQQDRGLITIGLTTTAADGCQNNRIYLYDSDLGETHVQRAFSMALAAQSTGREIGMVIDADVKSAGGRCKALGNMLVR